MPRRRPTAINAAGLPASRLPVGTPLVRTPRSPSSAGTSSSSPPLQKAQFGETKTENTHPMHDRDNKAMATKPTTAAVPTTSLADAKLARQQLRNQQIEATLGTPPQLDRRNQASRGKGKQWKPFDFTADSHSAALRDVGVEVRINTFRAPSRALSMSRSASVLSHRTSETGTSDMERQDSMLTDGFQLIKSRKYKKHAGELNAYEDKPEERQATVEATFDERNIYEVFGNALPGQDFIHENVGQKNGQLQFIQHPNGDVSAHQWSQQRYIWENIGQFSNIRKKVEGQLAADRLRGETASQTLQQNTLAYFGTIAKQREAMAMGLPFGLKEIQAAMPEKRVALTATLSDLKEPSLQRNSPASQHLNPTAAVPDVHSRNGRTQAQNNEEAVQPLFSQPPPQGPRYSRPSYAPNYGQLAMKQDDPFYSGNNYQQIYGQYPYGQSYYNPSATAAYSRPPVAPRPPPGLNYDFHFPPVSVPGHPQQVAGTQSTHHTAVSNAGSTERQSSQSRNVPSFGAFKPAGDTNLHSNFDDGRTSTATDIVAPRPKPATPSVTRTPMVDQLWKLSESAKERSHSQTGIPSRTVLYDPLRDSPSTTQTVARTEHKQQEVSPTFSRHVVGGALERPSVADRNSDRYFPSVLAPKLPAASEEVILENDLRNSSPDTNWVKKEPELLRIEPPPTFKDLFSNTALMPAPGYSAASNSPEDARKAYEEGLNHWWTSGNKFARQEEFFQSVMASHKTATARTTVTDRLAPIGPPSATTRTTPQDKVDPVTTRLLIPVLENLAAYVQGPVEKRRDYWCQWVPAPEWCIDRSETGNKSFFDDDWGQPPARVGRDPRYSNTRWPSEQTPALNRFGGSPSAVSPHGTWYGSPYAMGGGVGLDKRFGFS